VALRPSDAETHYRLARLLLENERAGDAVAEFEEAVRLAPADADMRNDFGIALATAGRVDDARLQFREALRLSPRFEAAARNLAATGDEGSKK
jgi:Flp pilus assembly protein TadD